MTNFDCDDCGDECTDIYQVQNDNDSFLCEDCYDRRNEDNE